MAVVGLTVLVALLTAGFFVGLALLAVGILFWAYVKLRAKDILGDMQPPPPGQDDRVIEAEYQIVEEKEESREK